MKVIYTTASPLGGTGLAEVTAHAVAALADAGWLAAAVTTRNRSRVPAGRIREVRFQPTKLLSFLPARHYYPLKRAWVDRVAAGEVRRRACDVVHGWTHECLRTLHAARRAGAVALVERNYAHPRHSRRVLAAEYERAGIPWPPRPWPGLARYDHWERELGVACRELEAADVILAPSRFARATMLQEGVPAEKVRVLPRGVDVDRFAPGEREAGTFRVVFVGQVCLRKGIRTLLEAWRRARLDRAELRLLGTVHEEVRPLLAQAAGLPGLVIEGGVRDVAPHLRRASVLAFPTLDEGSAKVVSEAMAAGLAVVTTEEAGSLVEDGKTGFLVPAGDAEALADRLARLQATPAAAVELGRAAREAILPFTWARYREELLEMYRSVRAARG